MVTMLGTIFESASWYERIAQLASAVALWASAKAHTAVRMTPEEAMKDLTLRLQHPWQYRIAQVRRLLH